MKTIALLSGKGGSGKTTLGLTISSIMSNAGLKVLLIDCDFSTHGATYFFEEQLPQNRETISFFDVVEYKVLQSKTDDITIDDFIKVESGFYFIPSVMQITDSTDHFDFMSSDETRNTIWGFIHDLEMLTPLDVIIFDCQAGSSSILPSLLVHVDIALMVMEPDKVSSSALRSLYTVMK